jgi:hypothetical protein
MRFAITLRNILLMSTTAAFMPLLGAASKVPHITSPTNGATFGAGTTDVQITWYVMKMKQLGEELISG